MKIKIEDKNYELDVQKALKTKSLLPSTDISVGDVFRNSSLTPIIIIKSWSPENCDAPRWSLAGLGNTLQPYSNLQNVTKNEMIEHLDRYKYKFVKNINDDVKRILDSL